MALARWQKVRETTVAVNPWWRYRKDAFLLPSGKPGEYHYVHTNGAAMIIPFVEPGKILLVNQYRYLCDRESVEFPCGSVKDGATHVETARHELVEETGYAADELTDIGRFNPYNGVTDEICHVYRAGGLRFVGASPDETEEFELLALGPEEIGRLIADGTIWDGMTIAGWAILQAAGAREEAPRA
jgi:ADP-ribose pyrophosphatase